MKVKSRKRTEVSTVVVGYDVDSADNVLFKHVQSLSQQCVCVASVPAIDSFVVWFSLLQATDYCKIV